jgi:RNA polymerase sigma-70 factor, ECF subfamily
MTERHLEDSILISRSQAGDRSAFNALVEKHQTRAYQYAYRLTRNSDEASDIVVEAFLRVFNALPNFKGQSSFITWLYRIMTNCYLDHRKRDKSKRNVSLDSTLPTESGELVRQVVDTNPSPYDQSEKDARSRRIDSAVNELPEYQRAMIVMYHAEMMSYEEIASALDLPVGTVKSRLNRARLSLRDLLSKDEELFRI